MIHLDYFTSINEVPINIWDSISSKDAVNLESGHLRAIENSRINNISPYYFIGTYAGVPIGIAYGFAMDVDFSRISNRYPANILDTVKSWMPEFMVMRTFEIGHLASLGSTIEVKKPYIQGFLATLTKRLDEIARQDKLDLCIVRDIPSSYYDEFKSLETSEYIAAVGYPIARIRSEWKCFDEYLMALKSKKRYNINCKLKKIKVPEISVEVIEDYAPYADTLAKLWKNVALRNNGYDHEKLTPEFFISMSKHLNKRSHVIAIKQDKKIVAYGLNLIGDKEYFGVAEGLDYSVRDRYDLYGNNFFQCIRMACELNKSTINLGITAYDYKASIGARFDPCLYFVKAFKNKEYSKVYANFIEESIKQPQNNHRVFRNTIKEGSNGLKNAERLIKETSITKDPFAKHYNYARVNFARATNLYTYCPEFESAQEAVIKHQGRDVIMLGTNSYLGLATHAKMKAATIEAIHKYGTGCSGSPLLNGTLDIHKKLSQKLAHCFQKQDALIFSTGYQTNIGVVSTLVNRHDIILMDERSHASLVDGALLSDAKLIRYKHNDLISLEKHLKQNLKAPKLLIADSVFSMEGTIVILPEIVSLAKKYNARIMLDESHAIGVLGANGMGVADHYGLSNEIDVIMGTFSKSFASIGGFIASDKVITDMLKHKARSHIFSASLPPASVSAVITAIDIIKNEPELRNQLIKNTSFFAQGLRNLGYRINQGSAIISIHCGHEVLALAAFKELFKKGVFVNPVTHPAVPKNHEMLRISLMATHTDQMLTNALDIFKQIKTPSWP